MKAKDYLRQVKKIDLMIRNKNIEKEQLLLIAQGTSVASDGERVQSSGSKQKMEDAICKMVDIDSEIADFLNEMIVIRKDVIKTIELLPEIEYDLLHKLYIGRIVDENIVYLTLENVADENEKSYSWATTVHGRALKHVQDILDERKNDNE